MSRKNARKSNNVKESFERLAGLHGISLEYRWVSNLADKLDISRDSLSLWMSRKKIPKNRFPEIEKSGFPRDKWFREEIKYPDLPTIGSEGADTREPTELPYSLEEDRIDNMAPSMVHFQVKAEHHGTMVKVHEVLEGGEPQTTKALINNVDVFHEKIVEKRELTKQLEKQGRALQELKWETKKRDKTVAVMREELDGLLGKRAAQKK